MRARNIKPGFFVCPELLALSPEARLLFAGLWCCADREGRLEDRFAKIKLQVLPGDNVDVDRLLDSLEGAGFIDRYRLNGQRFIQVVNFSKHQNPHHREAESKIPAISLRQAQDKPPESPSDSGFSDSLIPDSCISGRALDTQVASEDVKNIFDHWNGKGNLVTHRRLTDTMKKHVRARLEDYSVEEITGAIDNYSAILASKDHLLDHRWTLAEFSTRAFDKFLTSNDPFTSYKKMGGKEGGTSVRSGTSNDRRVGYGKP